VISCSLQERWSSRCSVESALFLQAATLKRYDAPLSLTTLICFVGTLQAIVVTFAMEHSMSVWKIGFDMNLLAAAYAGIVTSSIAYYVQGLVMQSRGPVFASAFSPLMMIIVAIMGSFILAENIYLGGYVAIDRPITMSTGRAQARSDVHVLAVSFLVLQDHWVGADRRRPVLGALGEAQGER
jgi:drug/metabolite transporter (DMT)-like permease